MPFFTVTWRIENFRMCPQQIGEALASPEFSIPSVSNVKWSILLYPRGDKAVRDGDHISCGIRRADQEPSSDVKKFVVQFVFVNLDPVLSHTMFDDDAEIDKNKTNLCRKLIAREKLLAEEAAKGFLPRDTLTMRFHICPIFDGVVPSASSDIEVALMSYSYSPHFTAEQCFSNFNESGDISPTQSSFHTRIPVERRILYWRIQEVRAKRMSREKTSVKFESGLNVGVKLLLVVYVKGSGEGHESLRIDILRRGVDLGSNLIKCEATVFDINGVQRSVTKLWHFFGNDDTIKLKLEFHISYPPIKASEYSTKSPSLQKEILKMLDHEETIDASFECKNGKKFPVHKFLLCAKSPVFRAMFSSDTLEKQTGVVRMQDTETTTVQHLRHYLYSDCLPDAETEDILQLYSVADKYDIEKLKEKCAAFLKNDISVDNVCDILTIADMHQDAGLKSYASDFLITEMDLHSDTWRRFSEENVKLAAETMNCLVKVKGDSGI